MTFQDRISHFLKLRFKYAKSISQDAEPCSMRHLTQTMSYHIEKYEYRYYGREDSTKNMLFILLIIWIKKSIIKLISLKIHRFWFWFYFFNIFKWIPILFICQMPFQISLNAIFESPESKILSPILLPCVSIEFYIFNDNLFRPPILIHTHFLTFARQSYFLSLLIEPITLIRNSSFFQIPIK